MRSIRPIVLLTVFLFSASPTFAEETSCCDQLRKEVQVLKEQQDKIFDNLKQNEVVKKKSFTTMEDLVETLSNKFPDLKEALKKIKDVYDQLGKTTAH